MLLPICERVLGPENRDVLMGRAQFARLIEEAGTGPGHARLTPRWCPMMSGCLAVNTRSP